LHSLMSLFTMGILWLQKKKNGCFYTRVHAFCEFPYYVVAISWSVTKWSFWLSEIMSASSILPPFSVRMNVPGRLSCSWADWIRSSIDRGTHSTTPSLFFTGPKGWKGKTVHFRGCSLSVKTKAVINKDCKAMKIELLHVVQWFDPKESIDLNSVLREEFYRLNCLRTVCFVPA